MNNFEVEERRQYLQSMILLYENKLQKGVYKPSHFLNAIKCYREELEKLK